MAKFQKGQSGNPKGRPRSGETLAEAIRERWPPAALIELMAKHVDSQDEAVAMRAKEWISDRGYGKAPQTVDLSVRTEADTEPVDWSALPLERRRELAEALAAADEIAVEHGGNPTEH